MHYRPDPDKLVDLRDVLQSFGYDSRATSMSALLGVQSS